MERTDRPHDAAPPPSVPLDEALDAWWRLTKREQLRRDRRGGTRPPEDTDARNPEGT